MKKSLKIKMAAIFVALVVVLTSIPVVSVFAAIPPIDDTLPVPKPYISTAVSGEMFAHWDELDGVDGYQIKYASGTEFWHISDGGENPFKYIRIEGSDVTSYRFPAEGGDYRVYVRSFKYLEDGSRVVSSWSKLSRTKVSDLAAPQIRVEKVSSKGINLMWEPVEGAAHYIVWRRLNKNELLRVAEVSATTTTYLDKEVIDFTDKGRNEGSFYTYYVTAIDSNGVIGKFSNAVKASWFGRLTINNEVNGSDVMVSWQDNSLCDGYQIKYAEGSEFWYKSMGGKNPFKYVKIPGNNITSTTLSLKPDTDYRIYVRAYREVDGVMHYGSWSFVSRAHTGSETVE